MGKVTHIHSNDRTKDYSGVPAGLLWAIPIHECLERPEAKARATALRKSVINELAEENRRGLKIIPASTAVKS